MILPEAPHPLVAWVETLPGYVIPQEEFFALPEYSGSVPTGTRVGKIWRHNLMAYHPQARPVQMVYGGRVYRHIHPPLWVVRAYVVCTDPNHDNHTRHMRAGVCLAIPYFRPLFPEQTT